MSFGKLDVTVLDGKNVSLNDKEEYSITVSVPAAKISTFKVPKMPPGKFSSWSGRAEIEFTKQITQDMAFTLTVAEVHLMDKVVGEGTFSLSELFGQGSRVSKRIQIQGKGTSVGVCEVNIDCNWQGSVPEYLGGGASAGGGAADAAGAGGALANNGSSTSGSITMVPLPNCEGRSYSIRVLLRKCKNLQAKDDNALYDPLVTVSIGQETQKTEYQKQTNEPMFDEELMFMCQNVDSKFWNLPIQITVMDHRIGFPDKEIGMTQLEMQSVYRTPNHMLAHKWYILRKGGMSTQIMGFLKMTIMVLDALNDPIPEVDDDPEDGEEGEDNLILNLVNTPGAQFEEMYMRCEMYRAEGIPQMDVAIIGSGGKADPYVTLQYGVKKNRTPHLNSTLTPEWNAVAMIPVQVPALVDAFTLQLWDYNTAGSNDVIATHKLSISSLKTPEGLPNMPAQFINFYGSPRAYMPQITKPKFFQLMDKGSKDGIDFRGRMLCQFTGSRDRECAKDPINVKPRTTNLHVVVILQALQFSMLKSGTFTFTVTCGNGIDEKPAKCRNEVKSQEMRGTSSGLGSVYFGEEIRLERRIEVALPPSYMIDPVDFQNFIKRQIPDVILHLWNGSNMYSSFRIPATKLLFLPEAIYVCNSMRVVTDPDKLDEGEAPSDPLAQFHVGMFVKAAEPGRTDKAAKVQVEDPLTPEEKARIPLAQDIRIQGIPPGAADKFLLEGCVYRAVQVPPADPNGLADPFVRVSWANGCAQTGVQCENLNPNFDEMIHVYADTKQPFTDIIVEIWDWDLIGSNEFLCRARVSVDQAVKKAGEIFWIDNFVDNRGKPLQDTRVLASFEVFKNPDKNPEKFLNLPKMKVPKKSGSKDTYTAMKIRPGKELVTQPFDVNISLLHLRKMRPFRLLDVKQPSVEVTIANSTVKFEKLNGPNPDINKQAKLTVELPINPEFWPNLNISVFDHRALGNKPRVGVASQRLTRLVMDKESKKELIVSTFDPARKEEAKAKAEADLTDRLNGILTWKVEKFGDPLENQPAPDPGGDLRANISFELEARKRKEDAKAKKAEKKGKKARNAPDEETALLATTNGDDGEAEELGESQNELDEADLALELVKRKQIEELMPQELKDKPPAQGEVIDDTPKVPNDIPWNERFDADEHVKPKEFIVSRLGKIHDYLKSNKVGGWNKANEGTAEAYFGPFTGDVCQVPLMRGSGKSVTKGGELTFDLVIKKADDASIKVTEGTVAATANDARKPMKFEVRAYIIACRHLAAVDHSMFGNSSDPFVILSLTSGARNEKEKGTVRLNLKELRKEKTLNPDYYMMHQMQGEFPRHNTMSVEVYDYEAIGSDTLIGFTDINLEERWYSTRGYSARRDYMEPGYYTEKRQLRDEVGQIQGTIELWIDMFDAKEKIPKPIDITPPPPIEFELRTIIWACRDVELEDMSFSGEAMTDIYVRCWMNGLRHDIQNTDVHYRSLDGSGTFNWRMNFRFLFDPRSKRIMPIAKKASSVASWFRIRREQKKFDPILKLQIFDNNFFPGTDSFIGEASLNLLKLNPALVKRSHSALIAEMLTDMRKMASKMVCCKCCYKEPNMKDMTLEQRQKIAVDEFKKDQEERNKIFVNEAEEKMKKVRSVGGYTDAQLDQFYQKFLAEARASAKVNAFEAYLPGKKKKPAAGDKKAEAPEPGKHLKAVQQLPPTADTAKYWFMTRGPKGGGRVGDVQISFQLVRMEALEDDEKLAAGLGRSEPQALPDPNRPDTSYFWLTSPFKAAMHILWKRYRWYLLGFLAIVALILFLYVFLRTGVQTMAQSFF